MASVPSLPTSDAHKIQARAILAWSAEPHDSPVSHHRLKPEHMVHRDAVLERVRAAGVGGHVSADRARPLARRVGRVVKAGPFQRLIEPGIDHAGLHDRVAVAKVDLLDRLHPRQNEHQPAANRQAPAGQARARAARHDRNVELIGDSNAPSHFVGRSRERNDVGRVLFDDKAVALVNDQLRVVG